MKSIESTVYTFGEFRLETKDLLLMRGSEIIALAPKAVEVLRALVEGGGKLVTKEEIIERVWANTFVEEANLTNHISALRKTLGENKNGRKFIETIPRRGYRFVAPINRISDNSLELTIRERSSTRITEEIEINVAPEKIESAGSQSTEIQVVAKQDALEASHIPKQSAELIASRTGKRLRHSGRRLVSLTIAMCAAVVAIFSAYWLFLRNHPIVFQPGNIRRLTTSGRAAAPKISPDGRYILYLQRDGDERSIWIRQIATGSDVRVTLPTPIEDVYGGITFSPGGDFIYYSLKRQNEKYSVLYQVPAFGGAPKKILENLVGPVGFAPDGKHFAFFRQSPAGDDYLLMSADTDGTNERIIAERQRPNHFNGSLAWSPDGATILCATFSSDGKFHYEFVAVNAESGAMQTIRSQNWQAADSIVWLPDGKSFLLIGQSENSVANQIWQVNYPGGEAHQITNDADRYASLGVTADGRLLTAGKLDQESHLWLTDIDNEASARQITGGANNYDGVSGLRWLPGDKIFYHSKASGADAIWLMTGAIGDPRKIADGSDPAISPDGRCAVFQSSNKRGLWRVDLGDGSLLRLTEQVDFTPEFSPDGRWIYFCRFEEQTNLYRISAQGGTPQLVTDEFRATSSPAVSPDGKTLAIAYGKALNRTDAPPSGLALINLETDQILKTFDVPEFKFGGYYEQPTLQWTPDGAAVNFIVLRDGISNVWRQPIAGGNRIQVTNFRDHRIFNFSFSPDGKRIALARGGVTSDVVMIENLK